MWNNNNMCVCVTGHRSVECVQNMRWWISNLRQWPLWNLGSVYYCYIAILDPTCTLLLISDVLPGEAYPSYPDTPFINIRLVFAQDHPLTWESPISVPEYWYSHASPSPVAACNPPLPPLPRPCLNKIIYGHISNNVTLLCFKIWEFIIVLKLFYR